MNTTLTTPNKNSLVKSYGFFSKLTTQAGIIQHTKYGLQDRKNGYSLDDNARAILVAIYWSRIFKDKKALDLAATYLAWLYHAQTEEGYFYNFSNFDNQFKDILSEDGFGRAFWALGFTVNFKTRKDLTQLTNSLIEIAKPNLEKLISPRAIAYCLLGLVYLAQADPKEGSYKKLINNLAMKLINSYKANKGPDWHWFENIISYSNHLLPLALFKAYSVTKTKSFLTVAIESLEFLESVSWVENVPSPVGNHGWLQRGRDRALYDQQPIEASEAVLAHLAGFEVTKNKEYMQKAFAWFGWYHGNNLKKKTLINKQSGGCFDSLTEGGVNENQGAESIISYLIASLALLEEETKP